MRKRLAVYILLFTLALLPRIAVFFLTDGTWDIDSLGRLHSTLEWMRKPELPPPYSQAFFYFYILRFFLKLCNLPFLVPRLASLTMSLIFVFLYYETIKLLYNHKVALLSGLLLCFYPLHIMHSTILSSTAVFSFFVFLTFYFVFLTLKTRNLRKKILVLLAALSLIVASNIRFEGYLLFPLIALFLISKDNKRECLAFSLSFLLFFILFQQINFKSSHSLFTFFIGNLIFGKSGHPASSLVKGFFENFYLIVKTLGLPMLFIAIAGFLYSLFKKDAKILFLSLVSYICFYALILTNAHIHFTQHYILPIALLLLPLVAYSIVSLVEFIYEKTRLKKLPKIVPLGLIAGVILFSFISDLLRAMPYNMQDSSNEKEIARWISANANPEDVIYVEDEVANIIANIVANAADKNRNILPFYEGTLPDLEEHLRSNNATIAVVSSEQSRESLGRLKKINGRIPRQVYKIGNFEVYCFIKS